MLRQILSASQLKRLMRRLCRNKHLRTLEQSLSEFVFCLQNSRVVTVPVIMSVYVAYVPPRTGSSDAPTPATEVDPAATPLQTWRSAREGSPYRSFRSDLPTTYSASDHGLDSYSGSGGSDYSGATLQDQVEPDQEYVGGTAGLDRTLRLTCFSVVEQAPDVSRFGLTLF